jgi:predicted aspartyl protease
VSTFSVTLQIANLAERRFEIAEALIDTGSTYSAAPANLLQGLGIQSIGRERFRIATGEVIESEIGEAVIRIGGRERTTPITFNLPGEPILLGAVTLEQFLLGVDPVGQRLVPVEGLRM